MYAQVSTVAFEGIEAKPVDVQVQITPGLPAFTIVGLPDKAVGESRERVRGALAAIENGFVQGEIQTAAYEFQQAMEAEEEIVVGVNAHTSDEELTLDRLEVDPALEADQQAALKTLRANRDQDKVTELLNQLETAAKGEDNLMPLFITCVENQVTLGEICGRLRTLWGEYQPPNIA